MENQIKIVKPANLGPIFHSFLQTLNILANKTNTYANINEIGSDAA